MRPDRSAGGMETPPTTPAPPPAPASGPQNGLDPRRAENVGSSECPALFSLTWDADDPFMPFETRLHLWLRKRRKLPDPNLTSERIFWGRLLEDGIARGVAELTGLELQKAPYVLHPEVRGMSATPDFLAASHDTHATGGAVLEIKNTDRLEFLKWPERIEPGVEWYIDGEWRPAERQPPFRNKLQPQHQLACLRELPVAMLGILVGGNELFLYRTGAHEGVQKRIEAEVTEFWRSVEADEPPAPNWSLDAETIAALIGDAVEGKILDLRDDQEALELASEYDAAREVEKVAAGRKEEIKAKLIHRIGDAWKVLLPGGHTISAGMVKEAHVSYTRKPYRNFRVNFKQRR